MCVCGGGARAPDVREGVRLTVDASLMVDAYEVYNTSESGRVSLCAIFVWLFVIFSLANPA